VFQRSSSHYSLIHLCNSLPYSPPFVHFPFCSFSLSLHTVVSQNALTCDRCWIGSPLTLGSKFRWEICGFCFELRVWIDVDVVFCCFQLSLLFSVIHLSCSCTHRPCNSPSPQCRCSNESMVSPFSFSFTWCKRYTERYPPIVCWFVRTNCA